MFNIAICDDQKDEREKLADLLNEYFAENPEAYNIRTFTCGENLISEYKEGSERYDLIFMDIFMGGINGFEELHGYGIESIQNTALPERRLYGRQCLCYRQ